MKPSVKSSPPPGERRFRRSIGDSKAPRGRIDGPGVFVLGVGVALLGSWSTLQRSSESAVAIGYRTDWATRVPMSRKRMTATRSALRS